MKSFIVLLSYCFLVLLLFASPVLAAVDPGNGGGGTPPPSGIINPVIGLFGTQAGELTIAYILATLLRLALVAAGILLLIYLTMGGIQWLTSGGEKTAVAAARDRITAAFIGLILIVLVLVIIDLINRIFGLDILHPTLPTPE